MTEHVDLPNGWHWGCGESTGGSQTYWFYTNLRYHYQGQLYTDPSNPWTVQFFEETGRRDDGDVQVSDYPCRSAQFETESEARQWLRETAQDLLHDKLQ